jgi:DNA-binding transcriptional MerR regulator/methylmalonyl-CoA mutase cobalamin-binding subunit
VHTISHAARLTGVSEATLRAWERRYAVVSPVRSPGGYRLYDDRAVRTLTEMASLVAAGWSARAAAEQVSGGTAPAPAGEGAGSAVPQDAPVLALVRAAAAHDPHAAATALDEAFAVTAFEHAVDTWLLPALRALGDAWQSGRVDVAGEHLVSATVHRRLGAALDAAGRAAGAPRVLVGLAAGSRHELGLLAFAVALRRAGADVVYLGTDLPPQSWAEALRHHSPAAVVLGVPMADDVVPVREALAAVRAAAPDVPVHVGGSAQDQVGQGAIPLGHTVREATATLTAALARAASG